MWKQETLVMVYTGRTNSGTLHTSLLSVPLLFCFASPAEVEAYLLMFTELQCCTQTLLSWCNTFNMPLLLPVETWVWLAALTAPSAWPRRPLARMTSPRSQKVSMEWRRGWLSFGTKLWWGQSHTDRGAWWRVIFIFILIHLIFTIFPEEHHQLYVP